MTDNLVCPTRQPSRYVFVTVLTLLDYYNPGPDEWQLCGQAVAIKNQTMIELGNFAIILMKTDSQDSRIPIKAFFVNEVQNTHKSIK